MLNGCSSITATEWMLAQEPLLLHEHLSDSQAQILVMYNYTLSQNLLLHTKLGVLS